jgi:hypothetical protein
LGARRSAQDSVPPLRHPLSSLALPGHLVRA